MDAPIPIPDGTDFRQIARFSAGYDEARNCFVTPDEVPNGPIVSVDGRLVCGSVVLQGGVNPPDGIFFLSALLARVIAEAPPFIEPVIAIPPRPADWEPDDDLDPGVAQGRDDELARILLYLGDMDIGDEHDHALNTAIERLKAKAHRGLTVPPHVCGIPIVVTDLAPPDTITIIAKPE